MSASLAVTIGQYSDRGRKAANQDFHGALIPEPALHELKGIAIAIADGISSSEFSGIAAQTAIKSFLTDYYATSEAWPVRTAAHRVIAATNAWLHAQTRNLRAEDADSGYVCTLSVLVLKSRVAHLFHIGDSRIYRLAGASLEQLTADHRVAASGGRFFLSRALGVGRNVELDYQAIPISVGDTFLLTTDGVHDHLATADVTAALAQHGDDLDAAARAIAEGAYGRGSQDNLTIQIVRIEALPDGEAGDFLGQPQLPFPPALEPGVMLDGYRIVRPLHANGRSQVYLAEDGIGGPLVVVKVPGSDLREDMAALRRFLLEEWIGRRLNSPNALRSPRQARPRTFLYLVSDYVEGQTLTQWMADHPRPDLNLVRDIVEQIARGLRAFHRLEMLHQDLRPDNIMIDTTGTVKIIDFGSTKVAGVAEARLGATDADLLGTVQYMAPEYLVGETGTERSDIFSLGVIAYQMLTGRLPYGASAARVRSRTDVKKLRYVPALSAELGVPHWVDRAIEKAVHPDPEQRYEVLSEFTYDLRHPNAGFDNRNPRPLTERNPVLFWQLTSLVLAVVVVVLLARIAG